jgi:hypothetical protein
MELKYCSECFNPASKVIKHKNYIYCDAECLNERINMDRQYEWLVFKNSTDIYDNVEPLGALTYLT